MEDSLRFERATEAHLLQMMQWFPTRESCIVWGGPEFRFPFDASSFVEDARLARLASWVLLQGSEGRALELRGFGQYYLRAGRCHLARLAVVPSRRGQGLGTRLIHLLAREGTRALGVAECSLFVFPTNLRALALYERLGFRRATYPDETAPAAIRAASYLIAEGPPEA
jgi:ribosomal protein S18 acetylase RimI-like enzyme